jgi:uncharacterized membrane protein YfcA
VDPAAIFLIALLMGMAAALYTSVGHAGASAYLAIMALFAVAPETMRPTALVLNLIVASLATWRFARAGQINPRLLLICVAGAIPTAYFAGGLTIPGHLYRPLIGIALWAAAVRMLWPSAQAPEAATRTAPAPAAFVTGAAIGGLSGLTGTGGGIFLSPLILLASWEGVRRTSGTAAGFILCVSAAGLAGNLSSVGRLPAELPWFALAVVLGAVVGTRLGVSRLPARRLLQALGVVLLIAGAKLVFT